MGLLGRMLREALHIHVEHWRTCAPCSGRGWTSRALRAPDGSTPVRAVVAQVRCEECKGKGRFLLAEEVTENGLTRAWERGRLVAERRR